MKVLVVEDDPTSRLYLTETIEMAGYGTGTPQMVIRAMSAILSFNQTWFFPTSKCPA